jgi:CBS domain-containing protein
MAASRWSSVRIDEVMHRDVRRISPDMLLVDAARKMRDMDVGCLLVWESDGVVGIVTDRDITCRAIAEARNPETTTVQDVMSKDVVTCFDDQLVSEAAHIMRENKVRRLPVLDHGNHVVGILTLSDLSIKNAPELAGGVVRAMYPHQ